MKVIQFRQPSTAHSAATGGEAVLEDLIGNNIELLLVFTLHTNKNQCFNVISVS